MVLGIVSRGEIYPVFFLDDSDDGCSRRDQSPLPPLSYRQRDGSSELQTKPAVSLVSWHCVKPQ